MKLSMNLGEDALNFMELQPPTLPILICLELLEEATTKISALSAFLTKRNPSKHL